MKKHSLISVFLASVFFCAGFVPKIGLSVEKETPKKIDKVIVGTELGYPPYSFVDEKGMPAGFNVDLTRAIARKMDLNIAIEIKPWSEIRRGLASGQITVISGIYYSKERAKSVDFSPPYTVVHHAVFARRGVSDIKRENDLKGKRIVVMRGDIMHDYVLEKGLSNHPGLADTQADALRLLASGKYDYALIAKLPGLFWVKKLGLSNISIIGPLLRPSAYCYGVEKGNTKLLGRFDEGLAILKETNEIQEIYNKWLGVLEPKGVPKSTIMKYIGFSLLIFLLILAAVLVWIRTLRSQVHQRTRELQEEIAERESAEAALRESEALSRTVLDSLPAGVVIVDPETRVIEQVNDHVTALFGAPADELVGHRCHTFLCPADEGACPVGDLGQTVDNSDREMLRKNGNLVPILKTVKRIEIGGKDKFLECFVDVSERKRAEKALQESEKKFSALFHASPAYIALTDLDDGRFLDVNESFTKMTGYGRDEVAGRTATEIGLWSDPQERDRFVKLAKEQGGFHEQEAQFRRKDGAPLFGIWSAEIVETGGHAYLISVVADITERKKAQEALIEERDKLRVALSEIKTLSGLLPICASCKKIRDDEGYWNQIESYIGKHSTAEFTHSICPECTKRLYPDLDLKPRQNSKNSK